MECVNFVAQKFCGSKVGPSRSYDDHHHGLEGLLVKPARDLAAILVFEDAKSVEALKEFDKSVQQHLSEDQTLPILEKIQRQFDKFGTEGYLAERTIGHVLEKLAKSVLRALEVNLQKIAVAIGKIIGKIICYLNPLPVMEKISLTTTTGSSSEVFHVSGESFVNYSETVKTRPMMTFFPKTVSQVQSVVRHAKAEGKRVRVSGMRHTWTQVFADNDQILISMLPLEAVDTLTHVRSEKSTEEILREWDSDLSFIEFVKELPNDGLSPRQASVRVGPATTNLEMLEWSKTSKWTLPWDIIAVMISYGGSNATICHGAGIKSRSLSDLVMEVQFVNAVGDVQTVDDKELLKSVSGCFGILGVVVSLTLRLDYMTYARWQPRKSSMEKALPRPSSKDEEDAMRFARLCEKSYYTEFFWFPNNGLDEGYWENCFSNDGTESEATTLNDSLDTEFQIASTFMFDLMTDILVPLMHVEHCLGTKRNSLRNLIRKIFTKIVSKAGISALPEPDLPITTSLVEALHFRQGFHYISVREMELEIPIPGTSQGHPDWSMARRAWWDAIEIIQESARRGKYGCDMALEMRIIGDSDSTLAPFRGNRHGTVSIEPVSTSVVPTDIWEDFKVRLANRWASYRDREGNSLRVRPHWAKELPREIVWEGKKYSGQDYLKMIYKEELEEFGQHLLRVCQSGGYDLMDLKTTFSNLYFDNIFQQIWAKDI